MSFSEASRVLWLSGTRFMLRKRTAGLGSADRIRHSNVLLDTKIIMETEDPSLGPSLEASVSDRECRGTDW